MSTVKSHSEFVNHVADFAEYSKITKESPCVVKFTASWCGPCKRISPKYEALASQYNEKCKFLEVNIDEANEITNYENIQSIPLFIFYYGGVQLDSLKVQGCSESLLVQNIAVFMSKILVLEPKVETVVAPETKSLDMSKLTLDNIEDSDNSDVNADELVKETLPEYNSDLDPDEYGEECDVPIEKTINEN